MSDEQTPRPDWLAVGSTVKTVRRSAGGRVVHEALVIVTRHSPAGSVFARYPNLTGEDRYVRVGDRFELRPRYLDYTETLETTDA